MGNVSKTESLRELNTESGDYTVRAMERLDKQRLLKNYHTHLEEEYGNYKKPPDGADKLLECRRTQLEVSEELGIAQSVISRLWQRFQDDGHIGLYARRPVRCVPLTTTHCHLRLTWSREHALWDATTVVLCDASDESWFSFQSDSRRTLIWSVPGTRYHQENTIERHRYGGAGWLFWGGIILGSKTDLHVQSVTTTGHIYRDVILEQHVRLFWGAMGVEFLFMDDNARPHRANIVDECF
ncbi:transposable element Tcb1 transposase [Trichonephila clavipes]|nr:transposable element Tcb1 transposase [Trichonephila clavipes]